MDKWLNHPWTVAIGASVLAGIVAEVSPLRFVSGHILPWFRTALAPLTIRIEMPLWVNLVGPIIGAAFLFIGQYAVRRLRISKARPMFDGLCWQMFQGGISEFRPVCTECGSPLQPRIEPELRKDRNDMPFLFKPDYVNTLRCARCSRSIPLRRPWEEFLREANTYLKSVSSSHGQ